MKINKRILLIVLVAVLVLTNFPCLAQHITFLDVSSDKWYYEGVKYAFENKFMNGTSKNTFEPESSVTRGMIVTILHRLEGAPEVDIQLKYIDVNKSMYYYSPIMWATKCGIVNGYSEEIFAPDNKISREQFAAILYRYADYKGFDISFGKQLETYNDSNFVSAYAKDAMGWANFSNLISGTTNAAIDPQGTATRAQAATIFMRFDKWMAEKNSDKASKKDVTNALENEVMVDKEHEKPASSGSSNGSSFENFENNKQDAASDVAESQDKGNNSEDSPKEDDEIADHRGLYLQLNDVETQNGNKAEVHVLLKNNPGIMGLMISFEYDENAMKLTDIINGDVLAEEQGYVFTAPKNKASGCRTSWYTLEDECAETDGTLITLVFDVLDSVKKGEYPVKINYDHDDVIDKNAENLALKVIDGKIIVK